MSCSSPFVYTVFEDSITVSYTFSVTGSVVVPGYTYNPPPLCLLGWNAAHDSNCHWSGWNYDCTWVSGSHYWYDCTTVASIPVFPTLNLTANASIPGTFTTGSGESLSMTGYEAFETTSFKIKQFIITLSVNGEPYKISIPLNVTCYQTNGEFSATVALYSLTYSENIDGFDYNISMSFNLLFCAEPIPPMGWLNLQIDCGLSVDVEGFDYSTYFTIACPIISVEEE